MNTRERLEFVQDTLDDAFHHCELVNADLYELDDESKDDCSEIITEAEYLLEMIAKRIEAVEASISEDQRAVDQYDFANIEMW